MNFNPELNSEDYFDHEYNHTLHNERCVEVSLGIRWIEALKESSNVIEVGAVLPYYQEVKYRVVDLYDKKATDNIDVMKVDLTGLDVLSISTIEHIGMADYQEDWKGVTDRVIIDSEASIEALRKILDESNSCLVSVPIGYNVALDSWLQENLDSLNCFGYEKLSMYDKTVWPPVFSPTWKCRKNIIKEYLYYPYYSPYPYANFVLFIQGWK